MKNYFIFSVLLLIITSCYSSPKAVTGLIDYYEIQNSTNIRFEIGIEIYNRNLNILRQNILNEIFLNNGIILADNLDSINFNRIIITIPKDRIFEFMTKIKEFGIVVNETLRSGIINNELFFAEVERTRNLIERYEALLATAESISDKMILEREISMTRGRLESFERDINEIDNIAVQVILFR